MKNLIQLLVFIPIFTFGQSKNWVNNPLHERAFITNEGQFNGRNWDTSSKIEYAVNNNPFYIFFTKQGLTYRFDKIIKLSDEQEKEHDDPERKTISELIRVNWIGANKNVKIIANEQTNNYFSYAVKNFKTQKVSNINHINGYKKITYKNLYNNIDVIYTFHPDGGIKYNVILHPGADPSQLKLQYITSHTNVKNENITIQLNTIGELEINTSLGKILEHTPVTFYNGSKTPITSKYTFNNNVLSFNLANYDNSKEVVIDPWIVNSTFNASSVVFEVETDNAGNIYVIGGESPMELKKYTSAGVLVWNYVTPWDTANYWLGTLATDNLGTSYVTAGTSPEIERIDNTGAMIWHKNGTGTFTEYWSIIFNCDATKLIVGGTSSSANLTDATIYDIDMATGNVLTSLSVASTDTSSSLFASMGGPVEVRSLASTKNSKYIFLTHLKVGAVGQDFAACSATGGTYFESDNTDKLGYKCETFLPKGQNGGGLKALTANDNYFYTHKGDSILQWDINTGIVLNRVALPGGSATHTIAIPPVILSQLVVDCSGLDVDAAGNVYAGSMDRVVKFDANLNILSTAMTTGGFSVYDVSVNSNGEVVAVGAIGDNTVSARNGRIESFNMSTSSQYSPACCDPNFCPINQLCNSDAPVSLNPTTTGGIWSISPTTTAFNTTTGVFDPALANPGTYTVTYTLSCGSNSSIINVGSCAALTVCIETNGDLTVSGGIGPYTWNEWLPATSTPITNQTECSACGGIWLAGIPPFFPSSCTSVLGGGIVTTCDTPSGWSNFGTGVTITPSAGVDSIKVVDGFGDSTVVTISTLSPCSTTCDATITQAGPFCVNATATNLTAAQTGGTWSGTGITNATNGTFDPVAASTGSHVITYTLSCGSTDTMTIVVNTLDSVGFSYAQGSYCLTDPNPTPTNTGLSGGTYTINNGGTINPTTGEINITSSGAGTYTVTYTTNGACPNTGTFNILLTSGANATITQVPPVCANNNVINLTAVDAGGVWSGTGVTGASFNPAIAGAGNHIITYTISGSCGDVDTMTIVVNAADSAYISYAQSSYCLTDPNPTPTLTGTTGGTYTINNGGNINATTGQINITATGVGNYLISYFTTSACPDTVSTNITINNCTLPQPVASFSASLTNICTGDCINFTDMSTSASGGITNWSWSFTGASTTTSTNQNPTNICYPTAGSYQVMLTVTDANGTDDTIMTNYINVTSCTLPTASFGISDSTICAGNCINFTDMSTGASSWLWTFNGGTPNSSINQNPSNICFNIDSNYVVKLVVSNSFGADSTTLNVQVNATPIINAGTDVAINLGESTALNATGTNGSYAWSPPTWLSCVLCSTTTSTPDETITYTVSVVDSNGCVATDNVTVIVDFDNVIFVPNIFSPNGDGNNDILYVRGKGIANFNFIIYDRWGEKVFETTDLNTGWNGTFRGKKMNKAVFVYYLQGSFIDGSGFNQKGDITLIR